MIRAGKLSSGSETAKRAQCCRPRVALQALVHDTAHLEGDCKRDRIKAAKESVFIQQGST